MSLKEYQRKRNFKKTAEPKGEADRTKQRRFVIQKHAASRLHFDFRLELDGTLKSWAVPKGVPYAKGEKRLAVQVEDHPVSYIDFEGTIPKGQYGGGTVMVWDRGTFDTPSRAPAKELESGKLHFTLHGKKLSGEWYLVRLRDEKQWLLIKGTDDLRPVSKEMDDTSALSGKHMKELGDKGPVWQSKRIPEAKVGTITSKRKREPPRKPAFIEPMKARLVESLPAGEWAYEIKHDGYRAIAIKEGGHAQLFSRNKKDFAEKFPEVAAAVEELEANDAIIDGEIVALDEKGRSAFQLLQSREIGQERPPIFFYAFDLLRLNGRDLRGEPLAERKALLEKLLINASAILRYSASLKGTVDELLKQTRRLGLEGLIAKRKNSTYEAGQRTGAWVKFKVHQEQEFVIGGNTAPAGSRKHFGALLVGYQKQGELNFCGKVGTGFNTALLATLARRFDKLTVTACPFKNLPEKRAGRYGQGVTASEMKKCRWVKPKLVCQIKFSEWTNEGKLRQPVFLGLREDKDAADVVRETPS